MTSQDELRDRIKDAMVNAARPHDEPDADLMAQAVIDSLGLTLEDRSDGSESRTAPDGAIVYGVKSRVVGRWEA